MKFNRNPLEEKVKDICDMLENSNGYIQITSMPKKDA